MLILIVTINTHFILGETFPWDVEMMLGRSRNFMHDIASRENSIVDDLIYFHHIMEQERKMTPAEKKDTPLYQGPYLDSKGKTVIWENVAKSMV